METQVTDILQIPAVYYCNIFIARYVWCDICDSVGSLVFNSDFVLKDVATFYILSSI